MFGMSKLPLILSLFLATTQAALWPPGYSQSVLENLFARQYNPAPLPPPGALSPCESPCGPVLPPPPQALPPLPVAAPPAPIGYYLIPYPSPIPYETLAPPPAFSPPLLPPPPVQAPLQAPIYAPQPLPAYLAPQRIFLATAPLPPPLPLPRPLPPQPIPQPIPPPPQNPFFIPGISLKLFAPLLRQPIPPPSAPLLDPCSCINEPGACPCNQPPLLPPPIPSPIQAGPPCPCNLPGPSCNCLPPPPLGQPIPDFAPPPLRSNFYSQFGARKSRDSFKEESPAVEENAAETKEQQ